MRGRQSAIALRPTAGDERGVALIAVLVVAVVLTVIGMSLVGLMHTDITHASIQHAKTASFAIAQAGLTEAQAAIAVAPDPLTHTTASGGVTGSYGSNGQFTYWIDAGPAAGAPCGPGLKTLEASGEVAYLGRQIPSRVRACGIPGAPVLTSVFGVSAVELLGATARTYIAPYPAGAPGSPRGGTLGSFTEINFGDVGLRLNALSETAVETVALRDGSFSDYQLFGFSSRPTYQADPTIESMPWVTLAFGDIVKARPTTGPLSNRCGTSFACVTALIGVTDVPTVAGLRYGENIRHAYMHRMTQQVLPRLSLDPTSYRNLALGSADNSTINASAGLAAKTNSVYTPAEFGQLVNYLATNCPPSCLRGPVFVDGDYNMSRSVNLGGDTGTVTLAVRGDLILSCSASLIIRHDLTTIAGRQTPGILVFGRETIAANSTNTCGQATNGSGRLIVCG
ncbi:MAG: hypothetical protein ACT4PY_08140, partial [Armatimonadota bacterium]